MKVLVVRALSSISTDLAFGFWMGIPQLNGLCFLFLEFLGATVHTVLTKLEYQKLFSHGFY